MLTYHTSTAVVAWYCVLCPFTAQCAQQCLAAFFHTTAPPCQLENLLELSTRNSTAKTELAS